MNTVEGGEMARWGRFGDKREDKRGVIGLGNVSVREYWLKLKRHKIWDYFKIKINSIVRYPFKSW